MASGAGREVDHRCDYCNRRTILQGDSYWCEWCNCLWDDYPDEGTEDRERREIKRIRKAKP